MANTYTWNIANLERHVADGVVYTSHWTVNAERITTTGDTFTAGAYGSVGFGDPDLKKFIPYDELTPEVVIGWTQRALGGDEKVAEIEAALSARLDQEGTPTSESGLPWA
jgi:hypothetical protein